MNFKFMILDYVLRLETCAMMISCNMGFYNFTEARDMCNDDFL
jgi:hypothetical protein